DLLDAIYNATAPMTIHYYQVTRTLQGLTRIPLRQVGSPWSPGRSAAEPAVDTQVVAEQPARVNAQTNLYLPSVLKVQPAPPPEPDDPAGCPCGWFDALGRMFDYIPPQ